MLDSLLQSLGMSVRVALFSIQFLYGGAISGDVNRFTGEGLYRGVLFQVRMSGVMSALPSVWRGEFRSALVELHGEDPRVGIFDRIDLVSVTDDSCFVTVDVLRSGDGYVVRVSYPAVLLISYISQLNLLDVIGAVDIEEPIQLLNYTRDHVRRALEAIGRKRATAAGDCASAEIDMHSVAALAGLSESAYWAINDRYERDSRFTPVADYLGGVPIAFLVFHEVGHVWNGDFEGADTDSEMAADDFAIRALKANRFPPSIAVPALAYVVAVASASDGGGEYERTARCRLLRLLNADDLLDDPDRVEAVLLPLLDQLRDRRDHWRGVLAGACG